MKRGDTVIRNGLRYAVVKVEHDGPREYPSLVLEGSPAHAIHFPRSDLQTHEPPRNSGEGDAVNGPTPLEGGDESHTAGA